MRRYVSFSIVLVLSLIVLGANYSNAVDLTPIERRLPPPGKELPPPDQQRLQGGVKELQALIKMHIADKALVPDVEVFVKGLDLALRFNEFYDFKKDLPKADWALQQAKERLEQFPTHPWTSQTGLVVRGYRSAIDGSVQPYGLVIPNKHNFNKPAPLYVWLHGRGEKVTDLHFMYDCAHKPGLVQLDDTIVAHAFGRQCIGFKGPGEQDVLDVIDHVQQQYKIDPDRIVLMGFSMGGGGSKSVGCHYVDRFCAIHTGAGYSETAKFMKLKPEDYPSKMEQILWGVNDVPCYVRNLFAIQFSCYSGEKDGQIQAAQVMEEAYKAHGKELIHFIGKDTAHKYHPDSLRDALALVKKAVVVGRPKQQPTLSFQTQTLQYNTLFWLTALGLEQHWTDSRIDATASGKNMTLTTLNINRLRVTWPQLQNGSVITVDGKAVTFPQVSPTGAELVKKNNVWQAAQAGDDNGLRKRPGQQGPIDDIFNRPFLVVKPTGVSSNEQFQRWSLFEANHFPERWATVMRGDLRIKNDTEVTEDDIKNYHLVLWGDAASNKIIAKIIGQLPIKWDEKHIQLGGKTYATSDHALAMIYPNPLQANRYIVLNSALTWRENNDRNNSLQNPKLGDWAIIGLDTPPNNEAPGRIVATDFFDEHWAVK